MQVPPEQSKTDEGEQDTPLQAIEKCHRHREEGEQGEQDTPLQAEESEEKAPNQVSKEDEGQAKSSVETTKSPAAPRRLDHTFEAAAVAQTASMLHHNTIALSLKQLQLLKSALNEANSVA